MHLLSSILLLIVVSRILGELMVRLGQPRLGGEILAGFLLGPSILKFVSPSESLDGIAELSVFLIVLSSGLEMEFRDVINALKGKRFLISFLDFLIPFFLGGVLGGILGYNTKTSVFIGLCVSITALPVAVQILSNFKLLDTRIANYTVVTAIINDVIALLLLGVLLAPISNDGSTTLSFLDYFVFLILTSLKMVAFAGIIFLANRLFRWGGSQTRYIENFLERILNFFGREALFGIAVLFVLIFGSISESLGSHFIIGAFFGALLLSKDVFGSSLFTQLEYTINSINSGFLAPIFFANLGLKFSLEGLTNPYLLFGIISVAIASKVSAGYVGGRFLKMSHIESLGIGIMLNGRGVMELVVANIAYQKNLIDKNLFTCLAVMGIVTTVMTPFLFKKYVKDRLPT